MVSKEKWAGIIKDFHARGLPETKPRMIEVDYKSGIKRAISIIGPRRAGKTYEMFCIIKEIIKKHQKQETLYINFERADLSVLDYEDLNNMLETYHELYQKDKLYLFLDEIQNVAGWEKFARTCLDNGIKLFISGSSSKLLSREIATSMRGRSLTYNLYPFSFLEFLSQFHLR